MRARGCGAGRGELHGAGAYGRRSSMARGTNRRRTPPNRAPPAWTSSNRGGRAPNRAPPAWTSSNRGGAGVAGAGAAAPFPGGGAATPAPARRSRWRRRQPDLVEEQRPDGGRRTVASFPPHRRRQCRAVAGVARPAATTFSYPPGQAPSPARAQAPSPTQDDERPTLSAWARAPPPPYLPPPPDLWRARRSSSSPCSLASRGTASIPCSDRSYGGLPLPAARG
ncbi:unnamed protein product [Urochloa humidicola]